ncbi:hypothetical protein [Nocardioides pinisoli]|uniref:Integral membrane protein n=1 Tax=Nocardioides pinisoli TaxID=2950279 RepID=A0ABT1L1A7_9ACTN|nr:hypothetical protein [Nocardioides pinisoli]MCP3423795.1 hypothetical protein [Nocardioides pinisoli]
MDRRERVLAITAAVEAMLLVYGAVVAFLTASPQSGHDMLLGAALLCLAAPLAWHAVPKRVPQADPLRLLVIVPNAVLMMLCFSGMLGAASGDTPWPALVAVLAAGVIVVAVRLSHRKVRAVAQP